MVFARGRGSYDLRGVIIMRNVIVLGIAIPKTQGSVKSS